jgi:hypothetical protein
MPIWQNLSAIPQDRNAPCRERPYLFLALLRSRLS